MYSMNIKQIKYNLKSHYRLLKESIYYPIEDYMRLLKYDGKKTEIINQNEIRIIGLRRSGNHAIIG